jgi:hypothetical protein
LKRIAKWSIYKLLVKRHQQVLKRWLRYAENLSDEGKRSGKGLVGFHVGNEKGSVDLANFQKGRGEIPNCQVGKGEDVISTNISHQGVLTDEEEEEERPRLGEYSCETASRVNEDDDMFQTFITTKEKGQRSILIIREFKIFLPSGRGEASIDVVDVTEGKQAETGMEKEEKILKFVPTEEHPVELLTQWEMELKALEDWLGIPKLEGGCQEIAMPEETNQHELQLVEAGVEPEQEKLTGENMSEGEAKQKLSDENSTEV